jgi:hypothetical protein
LIEYKDSKRILALSSDALVAHLKFNDDVTDSAGSNNGTVTGTTTYVTGKVGKAFSFNGSSYITLANESNFDFERTDSFSVSFWMKTSTSQDIKMLLGKSEINTTGWHVWLRQGVGSTGDIHFNLTNTDATNELEVRIQSLDTFDDNWHHVVFTYDGTSDVTGVTGYFDNSVISNGTVSNTLTSSILNNLPVSIGDTPNGGARDYTGSMDDVRIYSRELDQSEVSVIYNGGTGTEGDLKPTNVQENSLLVEKDTARRYWWDAQPSYTTVEAGATADSNGGAAYVTYKQITGLTAGDEISHVTFDVYSTPTDTSFKGGVYTDSGNNPTTLLASGELTNQNVSNTYTTLSIPLTSNATVPSDGKVWVAIIPNKTNPLLRVSTSSPSYTNSKYSATTGSYTNYSNWMLSTASVQGAGENNVRFGVKIYHAPVWTMQPTYEDDFSSSTGWTTVGSNISITGGAITASSMTTQSENRIYKPLGFTIADDFVIEFEFEETAISHGAHYMLFTLTAGSGNINNATNQDAIQIWVDKGSPTFYLRDKDGTTVGSNTSALTFSESTRYYVTLVNNNRTVTYTVRTGSHTGTVLGTGSITLQSGITGLTHIQSGSMTGNSGTTSYTLDNLKIYNGVSSIN